MLRLPTPVTLSLAQGELLSMPHGMNARVVVRSGAVWITRRDDPEDHFLLRGESFELLGTRGVLISAEAPALLALQAPQGWRERVLRQLARLPRPWAAATVPG